MKAKKNWIITIVLLVVFLAIVQAGTTEQDTTPQIKFSRNQRDNLAGLKGVQVSIEDFSERAKGKGFDREQYQASVELKLRQYGIKVFSEEEAIRTKNYNFLTVAVTPVIVENSLMLAVGISVEFKDAVYLYRDTSIATIATTWSEHFTLNIGLLRLNEVKGELLDIVDMFINDYYAANPTKNPPVSLLPTKATQTESDGKNGMTALYFTQGSHKDDVLRVQGTPDAINRYTSLGKEVWRYGLSTVEFSIRDDRVMQWSNFGNLMVKLEPRRNATAPPISSSTTKAPQKGLISAIIVSPSAIINDTIVHEGDTIDGVTVVKVHKDRVAFEMKGTNAIIRWTQKIGEAPIEYWE